ncbi:MAG: hypothetical protein ACRCX8_12455 [Sarcina sp.]
MFFTTKKNIRKHLILLLIEERMKIIEANKEHVKNKKDMNEDYKQSLIEKQKINKMILNYLNDVLEKVDMNVY